MAETNAQIVKDLSALLHSEVDLLAADANKKAFDKLMFKKYFYDLRGRKGKACRKALKKIYGKVSKQDAQVVARWLGVPCK